MQRVATCQVFWQRAGVVHFSQAPTSSVLCQPPNTPPSWIALAYITWLHTHQSVRPVFTFASCCFSWRSRSKGSSNGKGEALVSKQAQTPAYLKCLAGFIITVHCKHTHMGWSLCTCSTKAEELLLHCVQTKSGSQETLGRLTWIHCIRGLDWNFSLEDKKRKTEEKSFLLEVCVETCFRKCTYLLLEGWLGIFHCLFIPLIGNIEATSIKISQLSCNRL